MRDPNAFCPPPGIARVLLALVANAPWDAAAKVDSPDTTAIPLAYIDVNISPLLVASLTVLKEVLATVTLEGDQRPTVVLPDPCICGQWSVRIDNLVDGSHLAYLLAKVGNPVVAVA
jgi:hypothetical protein